MHWISVDKLSLRPDLLIEMLLIYKGSTALKNVYAILIFYLNIERYGFFLPWLFSLTLLLLVNLFHIQFSGCLLQKIICTFVLFVVFQIKRSKLNIEHICFERLDNPRRDFNSRPQVIRNSCTLPPLTSCGPLLCNSSYWTSPIFRYFTRGSSFLTGFLLWVSKFTDKPGLLEHLSTAWSVFRTRLNVLFLTCLKLYVLDC